MHLMASFCPARRLVGALLLASLGHAHGVHANPASALLRTRASAEIFNLDRDHAITTFREAIAADPQDAAAYRGLATGLWLSITFRRGNMTVDDYLGRATRPPRQPDAATTGDRRGVRGGHRPRAGCRAQTDCAQPA